MNGKELLEYLLKCTPEQLEKPVVMLMLNGDEYDDRTDVNELSYIDGPKDLSQFDKNVNDCFILTF